MSDSENEKVPVKKVVKKSTKKQEEEPDKHIYKYISLEQAAESIEGCTSHEIKKNEHGKFFVLFYNDEDELIEERMARERVLKNGEKEYVCYDQCFNPDKLPDNDFTKSFSPNIKKVLKAYQAASYIVSQKSSGLTKNNTEKFRVEYLNEFGEVLKISFCLKSQNNSYVTPWRMFYKLPTSN
jgi:hypothetical protein